MEEKRHVHIVSQTLASIGEVTQDIIEGLKPYFIITQESLGETPEYMDVLLCHYFTPKLVEHPSFNNFRHKILIFPVDGTELIDSFRDCLNKFDVIITPAHAGEFILKKNGIIKPIKVIPNFWKKEHLEKPKNLRIRKLDKYFKNNYVFYYEANYYPRKDFKTLIESYIETFSSNEFDQKTILLLKTDETLKTYEYFEEVKGEFFELQKKYKFPAKIIKISQHVSFDKLRKIWGKIDCYVHPAKIEGFGIPLLRMSVLEKPIIVLDNEYSGYNDYLKDYPFYFKIKCSEELASEEKNKAYSETSKWKSVDKKTLGDSMKAAKALYPKDNHNTIYKEKLSNYRRKIHNYEFKYVIEKYHDLLLNLPNKDKFIEHKKITGIKYICSKGHSGYAEAAKDYIIGLIKKNIPITVEYIEETYDQTNLTINERDLLINSLLGKGIEYNKVIIHSTPEFWGKYLKREKELSNSIEIIGMTVWEADKLDERWVTWINQVDKLIIPCSFNLEVFKNSGITIPIEIIPHVYKKYKKTNSIIEETKGLYTFYSIGQWTERKGIEDLVNVFLNTYTAKDEVCLLLKTFGFNYSKKEKEIIKSKLNSLIDKYKNPAKIILILEECTEKEIETIHNSGDCFVSLCKSEGWGLGAFDAAGYGNSVIITGWGGQTDFIIQPTIDYKLTSVKNMKWCPWHNSNQNWAQPDLVHAQTLMKEMTNYSFKENYELQRKIAEQSINVQKNYTYKKITKRLVKFLLN